MSHNPLLGSRISLISKKSIRYEGTLYSISETDATVALQNVRTYGTEGREGEAQFVPPQEGVVHPYLLFRGCDIKDLHVHESKDADKDAAKDADKNDTAVNTDDGDSSGGSNGKTEKIKTPTKSSSSSTTVSTDAPVEKKEEEKEKKEKSRRRRSTSQLRDGSENVGEEEAILERTKEEEDGVIERKERGVNGKEKVDVITPTAMSVQQPTNGSHLHNNNTTNINSTKQGTIINSKGRMLSNRRGKRDTKQMVGTGASLLRRKARGAVEGVAGPDKNTPQEDYDFQSNLAEFDKSNATDDPKSSSDTNNDDIYDEEEEEPINSEGRFGTTNGGGGGGAGGSSVYTKDDFFDSISSDVLDKKSGIDNRLRGSAERNLNTETFGAVSLGNGRRGGRRNRRGGGYGRGGGRGRGGRGRTGRGPRRENRRWNREGEPNGINGTVAPAGGGWNSKANGGGFPVTG